MFLFQEYVSTDCPVLALDKCEHGYNYIHPRLNKFCLRLWACKDGDIWYYSEQVIPLTSVEMSTVCEVKRAEKCTKSSCFPSETSSSHGDQSSPQVFSVSFCCHHTVVQLLHSISIPFSLEFTWQLLEIFGNTITNFHHIHPLSQ